MTEVTRKMTFSRIKSFLLWVCRIPDRFLNEKSWKFRVGHETKIPGDF